MCQLLGINSQQRFDIRPLLADFYRRGGQTDVHGDGWGIASFNQKDELELNKSNVTAAICDQAQALISDKYFQSRVVTHIRKATYGSRVVENNQPFHRSLWGQDWVYAHNGDLHDYAPESHPLFPRKGQTDSEKAFCQLLAALRDEFDLFHPKLDVLLHFLKQKSDEIAQFGTFNYLLANNRFLIAYASTELYWTQIYQPQLPIALVDSHRNIKSINRGQDNKVLLVATKPLTKGEVWYPMGKAEIRLFSKGKVVSAINPDKLTSKQLGDVLSFVS